MFSFIFRNNEDRQCMLCCENNSRSMGNCNYCKTPYKSCDACFKRMIYVYQKPNGNVTMVTKCMICREFIPVKNLQNIFKEKFTFLNSTNENCDYNFILVNDNGKMILYNQLIEVGPTED